MIFKSKIITKLSELKLSVFIDCLVNNNYSGLAVYGKPSKKKLYKAWCKLYDDYLTASKNDSHKRIFQLYKEIGLAESKYLAIQLSLTVLIEGYNEQVIKDIRKLGYSGTFPKNDKLQYYKDIDLIRSRSGGLKLQIELKTKELQELLKKQSSEPVTEADFDKILIELSRFQGYRLDTVTEFISCINSMNKEAERHQNEMQNLKKK